MAWCGAEVREAGDGKGLGVFARRPLQPGDLVLREQPVVSLTPASWVELAPLLDAAADTPAGRAAFELCGVPDSELGAAAWAAPGSARAKRVLRANSFETYGDSLWEDGAADGAALFALAARFNHSCAPNCSFRFEGLGLGDDSLPLAIAVRCALPVRAGAELTLSYLPELHQPRERRRADLRERFGFACACTRCAAELAAPAPEEHERAAQADELLRGAGAAWGAGRLGEAGEGLAAAADAMGRDAVAVPALLTLRAKAAMLAARCPGGECRWAGRNAGLLRGLHRVHYGPGADYAAWAARNGLGPCAPRDAAAARAAGGRPLGHCAAGERFCVTPAPVD
eukprot:TRINITY_DN26197_c0_g1_i1.p1 TRINITY_DN26197_c0_g1~~TRINITY_DN26197_c0_g1_i1.p1  ORF type:complete len:341 (+),score=105.69 TRINITY_DN26197_c0_g1_i1:86-1108(+)